MIAKARPSRGRPKGSASQTVYTTVRDRILSMEWRPGRDIDEMALVAEFGVSRTPVREALLRLAHEELVIIMPNRGAMVAPINLDEVRDFFELFDLCHRAVARWAAVRNRPQQIPEFRRHAAEFRAACLAGDVARQYRSNAAFHGAIAAACGNRHLRDMYILLLAKSSRLAHLAVAHVTPRILKGERRYDWRTDDHDEIVRLIEAHDADGAEEVAHRHTMSFLATVLDYIGQSESPGVRVVPLDGARPRVKRPSMQGPYDARQRSGKLPR